jgi:hypothetical protein
MTAFSQPERSGLERLQKLQTAQTHPDADLLTAFSEQTVTKREREQVLAHLAECPACREVVALALPQVQEEMAPEAAAKKPPVWEWPLLRWGALAASLTIVMIAVYLGTADRQQQVSPMNSETAPLAIPPAEHKVENAERITQPSGSGGMKAPQVRYEKVAPNASTSLALDVKAKSNRPSDEDAADLRSKEIESSKIEASAPVREQAKEQRKDANGPQAGLAVGGLSAPVAGANEMDKLVVAQRSTGRAAKPLREGEAPAAVADVIPKTAPPPPPAPPMTASKPGASNEAVSVTAQAAAVDTQQDSVAANKDSYHGSLMRAAPGLKAGSQSFSLAKKLRDNSVNTQWLVSPEGQLLNSFDQGATWKRQLPNQLFTQVQTIGDHVWASGPGPVLMHSTDGGFHWVQVIPSEKKAQLEGEITSIVFEDPNHGTLKTSTGQTWSTADAGKTWKKQ